MRSASIQEIKQELQQLKPAELVNTCIRLARFKKENKELLTYLLFESSDESAYIREIKDEMDLLFEEINRAHFYFVKKSLRKILRVVAKHVRYMGSRQAETELLLHFGQRFLEMDIPYQQSPVLVNLYQGVLKKLKAAIATLHEDLQHDYSRQLNELIL